MSISTDPIFTPVKFGESWWIMKIAGNKKELASDPIPNQETAIALIMGRSKFERLQFVENAYKIHEKPVVTVYNLNGNWLTVRIETFLEINSQRMTESGNGIVAPNKANAIEIAKKIAERAGLDFFPEIGENYDNYKPD